MEMAGAMVAWYIKPQVLVAAMVFAWCFSAAVCQVAPSEAHEGHDDATIAEGSASLTVAPGTFSCTKDLLPCQMYLSSTTETKKISSSSCCYPLDVIMATDRNCICAASLNNGFDETLNITRDGFRQLVSMCGLGVDETDYCKDYFNGAIADRNSTQAEAMSPARGVADLMMSSSTRTTYHLVKIEFLIFGIFFFMGL